MAKNRFTNFKKWAILAAMFLCLSSFVKAQWVINEGFEGGSLPSGWTYYDVNNDGSHWRVSQHGDRLFLRMDLLTETLIPKDKVVDYGWII